MKLAAKCLILFLAVGARAHAAPEDFAGTFKGSEKTEVSHCSISSYNGTTTGDWMATHEVTGDRYSGKGSNAFGTFSMEGKVSGTRASGTVTGVNQWNQPWQGEFSASLDGSALNITWKGSVSGSGCKFISEIAAARG